MVTSEYKIEIMTMFGTVTINFPETAWDEPIDTIVKGFSIESEKAFRLFIRGFGIGVTGIRIDIDNCSPVDLVRTLEINKTYNKDASIVWWDVIAGYIPGVNDDIYNPFEETEKELFPEGIILESSDIEDEANKAATPPKNDLPEPTEKQKKSGTYKKGHPVIGGLKIAIENPAGSERSGVDPDGKEWSIKMVDHYGYIKNTIGFDKDKVDVFINPNEDKADIANLPVFVVDQINHKGDFDEHKCMMGYSTKKKAEKAYFANYEKGWSGLGAITEITWNNFKTWVMDKDKTKKAMILESAYREDHSYGIIYVELPEAEKIILNDFANSLPISDFIDNPDTGEPWIEQKSHITVKYGLLPVDIKQVEPIIKSISSIKGVYGRIGVFDAHDDHDVLFLYTYSPDIIRLNSEVSNRLQAIESKFEYHPHVTIAYLKKGRGAKYDGMRFFSGINFSVNSIQYSDKEGNNFPIQIGDDYDVRP